MVKVVTLFLTKTAKNIPFWGRIYQYSRYERVPHLPPPPPPPGEITRITKHNASGMVELIDRVFKNSCWQVRIKNNTEDAVCDLEHHSVGPKNSMISRYGGNLSHFYGLSHRNISVACGQLFSQYCYAKSASSVKR